MDVHGKLGSARHAGAGQPAQCANGEAVPTASSTPLGMLFGAAPVARPRASIPAPPNAPASPVCSAAAPITSVTVPAKAPNAHAALAFAGSQVSAAAVARRAASRSKRDRAAGRRRRVEGNNNAAQGTRHCHARVHVDVARGWRRPRHCQLCRARRPRWRPRAAGAGGPRGWARCRSGSRGHRRRAVRSATPACSPSASVAALRAAQALRAIPPAGRAQPRLALLPRRRTRALQASAQLRHHGLSILASSALAHAQRRRGEPMRVHRRFFAPRRPPPSSLPPAASAPASAAAPTAVARRPE